MSNNDSHDYMPDRNNEEETPRHPGTPQVMRNIFGIFMILVYLGMGILMCVNFFGFPWPWTGWVMGILLIIYGIWRGYRQFKGIDSRF